MAEKKSFLRRVFSFGSDPEPARVPENEASALPEAEAGSPEAHARALPSSGREDADTRATVQAVEAEAVAPAEPFSPGEPTSASSEEAADTIVAADEPAWLDPAAPEPEADFSWLAPDGDGDAGPDDAAAMHEATPQAEEAREADRSAAPPAATPGELSEAVADAASPAARDEEPDFSFLAPDAPLPAEAEDDFSWLDADTPPEDSADAEARSEPASPSVGAVVTSGLERLPATPASGDGGWRVRDAAADASAVPAAAAPTTWFERLRGGLSRSSNQLSGSITALFTKRRLDEATLQEFEDVLIQADLGVETALRITGRLSEGRFGKEITGGEVRRVLADEVEATLRPVALPLELDLEKKPHVILVVGVNGTGKTTTIGKLAAKLTRGGLQVTLCAGDTFRAAAVEQLKIWGTRTGAPVIARQIGADAAGLAFEAYDAAVANGSDVLIIDTAGRLQNKAELMAELEKIVRVLQKREPDAPHTVLQTLDATTGQNALAQVEIFRNVAGVNGLVMTKLDGTARGGILVAIAARHKLPVYFIGVGEGIDDLEPFKAHDFAQAIAGNG